MRNANDWSDLIAEIEAATTPAVPCLHEDQQVQDAEPDVGIEAAVYCGACGMTRDEIADEYEGVSA